MNPENEYLQQIEKDPVEIDGVPFREGTAPVSLEDSYKGLTTTEEKLNFVTGLQNSLSLDISEASKTDIKLFIAKLDRGEL